MRRLPAYLKKWLAPGALGLVLLCGPALAEERHEPPAKDSNRNIELIQQVEPVQPIQPIQPLQPSTTTPTTATPLTGGLPTPASGIFGSVGGQDRATLSESQQSLSTGTTSSVVTGAESVSRATTDAADLLGKSVSAPGVFIQKRTPIVSDPRIRGEHVGQIWSWADGAYWFPARQDLDTMLSKIDSKSIRDILVIKGPYSVRRGPGFSFIDIATYDTPRYKDCPEYHGRSYATYSTNGEGIDGRQTFWGGSDNWGFRVGYGYRSGNDYTSGGGIDVPASYQSQDLNYAYGMDFSADSHLEFKGLYVYQRDMEFPGQYFDVRQLKTEGYNLRYTLENQEWFDRLTVDLWYNRTTAYGDTQEGAKQAFLQRLFNPEGLTQADRSFIDFSGISRGLRAYFTWGRADTVQISAGADFNNNYQNLVENLLNFSPDPALAFSQTLQIPKGSSVDPGVFLETSIPFSKRFTVSSGIRADWVSTNSSDRFIRGINAPSFDPIVFSVRPNDPNLEQNFDTWGAYITGEYKLDCHWTGLIGFGFAERPPTLTELYATGPFIATLQQGLNRVNGDPHLNPERLKQFDLGVRANYDRFRAGANGFYAHIDDYITYDLFRTAANNQFAQTTFTNTDEARLLGGEMYAEADVLAWLTPFAIMSYVQGTDLTHIDQRREGIDSRRRSVQEEPLPGIPPLDSRLGFRIHEARKDPRWGVEFSARVVEAQNRIAASLNELATPGFTIYDLRSYWVANQNLLLTAGVENLGDKDYREHLDSRAGNVLFQRGINFYFGMQVQY